MDKLNLIYNGDLSLGTEGWISRAGDMVYDESQGCLTTTDSLTSSHLIPIKKLSKYRISFDLRVNTNDTKNFYLEVVPYDNNKNFIDIKSVFKRTSTETTLAKTLNKGDTTATLTSSDNWDASSITYLGICNSLAWESNRATYYQHYSSIDGNVITFDSAYSGPTISSGTNVAEFRAGSIYYDAITILNSNIVEGEWKSYSAEFYGGHVRFSTQFIQIMAYGYGKNYSIRNIRLECINDVQELETGILSPSFNKNGIIKTDLFQETGMFIRYIKDDLTKGNSVNSARHWVEIQALNSIGENLAWGKPVILPSGEVVDHSVVTSGSYDEPSKYYSPGNNYIIIDLKYNFKIDELKIWHYYADKRTYYDHTVSVSQDGVTWYEAYKGNKAETADGLTIPLYPNMMQMRGGDYKGLISTKRIIET